MKHFRKAILLVVCVLAMGAMTACGSNKDTSNSGTAGETDKNVNDVTNGSDNGDGVVKDAADDVRDGVDDVTDDVKDAVDGDDMDNNAENNTNTMTK